MVFFIILAANLIFVLDTSGSAAVYNLNAKNFMRDLLQYYNTDPKNFPVALVTSNRVVSSNFCGQLDWNFTDIDSPLDLLDSIAYSGCNLNLQTYNTVSSIIGANDLPTVVITVVDEMSPINTPVLQTMTVL